jgi:serine/threonine protein phosphatase PrpC
LSDSDRYLILGSDGLWDEIKESDIKIILDNMKTDSSALEI